MIDEISPSSWDERRNLIVPGNAAATLSYCVKHFLVIGQKAIEDHGVFFVALCGGSTPKQLYAQLSQFPYASALDWSKVHLFWSDERSVPPGHPESNYKMAMDAGFAHLPLIKEHIHRMKGEENLIEAAEEYEQEIRSTLGSAPFDLITLGMGEDGHTASLFPHTQGLQVIKRFVTANHVPQKNTNRLTFTFDCINAARHTVIYALGESKKRILAEVLLSPDQFDSLPVQRVGTPTHKALWIADQDAASLLGRD